MNWILPILAMVVALYFLRECCLALRARRCPRCGQPGTRTRCGKCGAIL